METIVCKKCKRTVLILEMSEEFDVLGELKIEYKCHNYSCKHKGITYLNRTKKMNKRVQVS